MPSLEEWPTKAKEARSPHEVKLTLLDTNLEKNIKNKPLNVADIEQFHHHVEVISKVD